MYMYPILYCLFPSTRQDVLNVLVKLHRYDDMFLPDALRKFFSLIPAPNERGQFLETLLNLFSQQYLTCNPTLQMGTGKLLSPGNHLLFELQIHKTSSLVSTHLSFTPLYSTLSSSSPLVPSVFRSHSLSPPHQTQSS